MRTARVRGLPPGERRGRRPFISREDMDEALEQGGQAEDLVEPRGHVADPHLDSPERGVGPHIPPEVRGRVDQAAGDQMVHQGAKRGPVAQEGRDPPRRQAAHDLDAVGLEARRPAAPERAIGRERQQDGQVVV